MINEVIWFFLMGMIAGAVGVLMFLEYWGRKHVKLKETRTDSNTEKKE